MSIYYLRSERPYTESKGKISFTLRSINAPKVLKKAKAGKWHKLTIINGFLNGVMGGSGVYAIVIKNKSTGEEDICYIGSSKSVSVRLYSHKIVSFLTFYLSSDFVVDVYILYVDNFRTVEDCLIRSICPFLNHKKTEARRFEIGKKRFLKQLNGTAFKA